MLLKSLLTISLHLSFSIYSGAFRSSFNEFIKALFRSLSVVRAYESHDFNKSRLVTKKSVRDAFCLNKKKRQVQAVSWSLPVLEFNN